MSDRRPKKYRLSRTLKRFVEFRPMDDEHVRYVYAAYRKGALDGLSVDFKPEMPAPAFKEAFYGHVARMYDDAWVLYATSQRGAYEPVGYVAVTTTKVAQPLFIADTIWFPWASSRNRIESMVNWINEMRRDNLITEYAQMKDKRFFEHICRHGIMRRVGTKHGLYPDGPAAEFESVGIK
jgi:hypothetical protein